MRKPFGELLREARIKAGKTQAETAAYFQRDVMSIIRCELFAGDIPPSLVLRGFATFFGCSVSELLQEESNSVDVQ